LAEVKVGTSVFQYATGPSTMASFASAARTSAVVSVFRPLLR
jgi:hypothetical protein